MTGDGAILADRSGIAEGLGRVAATPLSWAVLLGAIALWLMVPPSSRWRRATAIVLGAVSVGLGAWYMLYLVQRVFFGRDGSGPAPRVEGGFGARAAAFVLAVAVVAVGCTPGVIIAAAGHPPGPAALQWESHHGPPPIGSR